MKDEIKEILEYVLSLTYGNENAIKGINKVEDYITNLQEENKRLNSVINNEFAPICIEKMMDKLSATQMIVLQEKEIKNYKSRNEKANTLLDEMLKSAYIDGEYIMYDYSTSELLEVKQALQGEDKEE